MYYNMRSKRSLIMKKKFVISFIVAFLAFGFVFYKAQTKIDNGELKNNNIEENEVEDETPEENKETEEELNPIFPDDQKVLKEEHGNELCFLLMGIDKRDAGQKEMRGQRSDTMMLCKVNFDDGSIKMLSLPRDSIVKIRGKDDKLTHAHSYGGPALTLKAVRDWLKLDVRYYVRVDYKAVEELVGIVGGVEFDVPVDMKYHDTTKGNELHINFKKGKQTITKDNVIGLLRFRKGYKDSSYGVADYGRQRTQQDFIKALAKKVLRPENILKIGSIWNTINKNVKTNIPGGTIATSILQVGIGRVHSDKLETASLVGKNANIGALSALSIPKKEIEEKVYPWFGDYRFK